MSDAEATTPGTSLAAPEARPPFHYVHTFRLGDLVPSRALRAAHLDGVDLVTAELRFAILTHASYPFADFPGTDLRLDLRRSEGPTRAAHAYPFGDYWHLPLTAYGDYEAYLASLSSKHRRSIVRNRRDADAAGCTFAVLDDWGPRVLRVHELYLKHVADHDFMPFHDRDAFALMAADPGSRLVVAELGGETIAAGVSSRHDDVRYAHTVGMDAARTRGTGAYFTLIDEIVRVAIAEEGVTRLSLGVSADDVKRRAGCQSFPSELRVEATSRRGAALLKVLDTLTVTEIESATPHVHWRWRSSG